jgi:drug/metabolite transporter (DMT)-like permease
MQTPDERRTRRAYLQVLLAGVLWATAGPFSVTLYGMGIPAPSVAFLRVSTGTLFLFVFMLRWARPYLWLPRRDLWTLFVLGGLMVAIFQLAYQRSTEAVGVPATVALLYLAPAWVVLLSPRLLGERLTPVRGVLTLVAVTGVWMTVFGARGEGVTLSLTGILWGCATGAAYGSYTLFARRTAGPRGALVPLFWSTLGGGLGLLIYLAISSQDTLVLPQTIPGWGMGILFGLVTMAVAPLLLFSGIRVLEAGRASIVTTIEPLMAALLSWWLLNQTLTLSGWLGLGILTTGVAGAYWADGTTPSGKKSETSPPPPG